MPARRGPRRGVPGLASVLVVSALIAGLVQATPTAASSEPAAASKTVEEGVATRADAADRPATESVTIDGAERGRRFDGVGGIVGHGATRLLRDYPEPERSQLLDYMFKPGYGASMQLLKVEIGGDVNATTGSTPSHRRARDEVNCERGHEWWLMKQAKQRQPNLRIAGLQWGAPGWLDGGFWSQDNIDYLLSWLNCAKKHGIDIDYLGGWNESGFEPGWFVELDRALSRHHPDIEIVAADEAATDDPETPVIDEMENNPAFRRAVDIIGWHSPCGVRDDRQDCKTPQAGREMGTPLWDSETSAQSHDVGAGPIARMLNRGYIDGKLTAHMVWPALWAGYGHQSLADTGMALAQWPWSGHYDVGKSVWAMAHTTQFTRPGWRYLDTGSTTLDSGATVASLAAPSGDDYSVVIETMDTARPTTVSLRPQNLPERPLQLWKSDLSSDRDSDHFVRQGQVTPRNGRVDLKLEPGHVYTLSTRTDAGRGSAAPAAGVAEQLELPFEETFEGRGQQQLAPYFADVSGGFQTEPCRGRRGGTCYEQAVTEQPIDWHGPDLAPTTLVGDPRWWGDYRAQTSAWLGDGVGHVELLGRVDGVQKDERVSGYHLRLRSDGSWRLYAERIRGGTRTLDSGTIEGFATGWHRLSLSMRAGHINVGIDGHHVGGTDQASQRRVGGIGLRANKWDAAQFDDVRVTPTGDAPRFVPQQQMSAQASSAQPGSVYGFEYPADAAIDGRPESYWRSQWDPLVSPPHALTLDLGRVRPVHALTYQPDIERPFYLEDPGSPVTDYEIWLSRDGEKFERAASGTWPANLAATKVATLDQERTARYVRLVARPSGNDAEPTSVTAAEVNVATSPLEQDNRTTR